MKRILALLAAGLAGAVVALLTLSLATGAFAQGPAGQAGQPTPGAAPYGPGQMMGRGQMGGQMGGQMMGRGQMGGGQSLVGMAAAELGLTQQELVVKLGTGDSIADALAAGGVDPTAFPDRFVASRAARLDTAVAAGAITREEADAHLAAVREMVAARIAQPFTALGPGQGAGFVDADGDGVCDLMPAGGQGRMGGGRGPHR